MNIKDITLEMVRDVLDRWHHSHVLGHSPLAQLQIVTIQRRESGYKDTIPGRGLAVREVIDAAVEDLRPDEEPPDMGARRWRPYLILSMRYRRDYAPDSIARTLSIGRTQYFKEQKRATQLLIDWLKRKELQATRRRLSSSNVDTGAPFQAIADLPYFVGRRHEVEHLCHQLLETPSKFYAIEGMRGVGKTTLAAHIAHELRTCFPNGVLWARLGISEPMTILKTFAAAYGRDLAGCTDLDSCSRVVRDIFSTKQTLIILDNVTNDTQLKWLLPPQGDCPVLVTTRRRDLWSVRHFSKLTLDAFSSSEEAISLFQRVMGREIVERYHLAFQEMSQLVDCFPLALDIIANRLLHEPDWNVMDFCDRLQDRESRLDELAFGEKSVRLTFELDYVSLPLSCQKFLESLGSLIASAFDVGTAATAAGISFQAARAHLHLLYNRSLLQTVSRGQWQFPALWRDYLWQKRFAHEHMLSE